jgi:hypothetical protein
MSTPHRPPASAVPTLTDVVGFEAPVESIDPAAAASAPPSAAVLPLRVVAPDGGTPSQPGPLVEGPVAEAGHAPAPTPARPQGHAGAAGPSAVAIDEDLLIQHVLVDVQRQVDRMFEFRVRETLGPAFARLLEGFIQETRHDLDLTLRDVVRRAVAQELARHRPR